MARIVGVLRITTGQAVDVRHVSDLHGGAIGGLAGALVGMGIPEYEAKRYEGRVKEGGILLSVHCDDSKWTSRAKDILKQTGGQDVASTGEENADFQKTDKPMQRAS